MKTYYLIDVFKNTNENLCLDDELRYVYRPEIKHEHYLTQGKVTLFKKRPFPNALCCRQVCKINNGIYYFIE